MKALNYLRQAKASWEAMIAEHGRERLPMASTAEKFFELAASAEKFTLPQGGRIFNDEMRGIDEMARLPFPRCLIEYEAIPDVVGRKSLLETERCSRRIVYVDQTGGRLIMMCMFFYDAERQWVMYPLAASFGLVDFMFHGGHMVATDISGCGLGAQIQTANANIDFADEVVAVLELIEALSCSNVQAVPLPGAKLNRSSAKRGALPFDEYKTLVVRPASSASGASGSGDSDRRSPREHLRRGHIRRLPKGTKIWIQSCAVAAGAAGRIDKNYDLRRFA